MKIMTTIPLLFIPAIASAQTYKLTGAVTGLMQWNSDSYCYIAVHDPSNAYYSDGYHRAMNKSHCAMVGAALLLGAEVTMAADVGTDTTNDVRSVEIVKPGASPYWPPYGKRRPP